MSKQVDLITDDGDTPDGEWYEPQAATFIDADGGIENFNEILFPQVGGRVRVSHVRVDDTVVELDKPITVTEGDWFAIRDGDLYVPEDA